MDFAVAADLYTCSDKAVLAQSTIHSNLGILHNVTEVPDRGAFTNVGTGIYAGSFVDFGDHGVWKGGGGEKGKRWSGVFYEAELGLGVPRICF